MPLQIDFKIDKLIKQIQKELKDEYKKEVSYDTIIKVLECQIDTTIEGMSRGDTVIWKYFGSFVATKKRVDALNKKYENAGKIPTLVDTGLTRMSFKRNGIKLNENEFKGSSINDSKEQMK